MKDLYIKHMAKLLQIKEWQVENCVELFAEGDTIPFISRYRKEKTGSLDDACLAELKGLIDVYDQMQKRKETIVKTIEEAGALTEELKEKIENCLSASELEDLYLPWKPKRRTRAAIAREKGLEPLAESLWNATISNSQLEKESQESLSGARDIVAERFNETPFIREELRKIFRTKRIRSTLSKENPEAAKYRSYFDFSMPLANIPSHNLLAMLRGEKEGILSVSIDYDQARCVDLLLKYWHKVLTHRNTSAKLVEQIRLAAEDAFKRLLEPSISSEVIREAKAKADVESVKVFGENLRQLLLSPPLGRKRTMAIDPGFRNGCKIVCLDEGGRLLYHTIIYPHPPQNDKIKAITSVSQMLEKYRIEAVAIGNGTASRETMEFMHRIELPENCKLWLVSEDGASIYSASQVAREEFPDEDVTVRGAVSIGRRLMDPLSELVKIDPKNLGIGQYQHDVDQKLLEEMLDNTVQSCVNSVGVNLNTASPYLLSYVAGIGPALAAGIVETRNKKGEFRSRAELMEVPRLGAKAFEQCAGFLRIRNAPNPLDNSAVHPESYELVNRMAESLGVSTEEIVGNAELCSRIKPEDFVTEKAGLPTINDILKELVKPGLDPREEASEFAFAEDIHSIEELKAGMELPGIVTNITNFGAFVDIGLHESGLLHVSKLGPRGTVVSKILKLHQKIRVRILDVDLERRRISLEWVKGS